MQKKEINMELLVNLVSIQSSYTEDKQINEFISKKLSEMDGVEVTLDSFGNIYAKKGKGKHGYKCIVAHTDTVHQIYKNRKVYIHDGVLFAMASSPNGSSPITQVGIGGDDKSGVYAAMQAMSEFDDIKAVFFRFEESGCRGSRASDMKFFEDCNFVVQLDRRGNSDFITFTNGITVASKEFSDEMKPIYEKYGFKSTPGVSTDVGALKSNGLEVSACNISAGYFDPHSKFETIDIEGLHNAYLMVCDMFNTHGNKRFEHKYVAPVYVSSGRSYISATGPIQQSLFGSSYFSETLKAIEGEMYEIVNSGKSPRMLELPYIAGWPKVYKFIDDDMIDMDCDCPSCGAIDSIAYLHGDRAFICMDSASGDWVESQKLYKDLKITENGKTYVYNQFYDVWLEKVNAKWDDTLETYVAK